MQKPVRFKIIKKKLKKKAKTDMQKPIWFEINKKEDEKLTRVIYNNQDNNDFEIIINRRTYYLKNAKKYSMEVITHKTTNSEAKKLYNELIQKDINALEREKNDAKREEINGIRKFNSWIFSKR